MLSSAISSLRLQLARCTLHSPLTNIIKPPVLANPSVISTTSVRHGWNCHPTTSPLYWKSNLEVDWLERKRNSLAKQFRELPVIMATNRQWFEQGILKRIHRDGPWPERRRRHPIDNRCQMKGVVLKTLIKKPKKPNSANRKCVLLKLTNGKEKVAHVPGVGHNLQEHSVVLVQHKRTKDVPGLRLKVIRGTRDCAHLNRVAKYIANKKKAGPSETPATKQYVFSHSIDY